MSKIEPLAPLENAGTAVTRFHALRHGVLSRYTVLPWEDEQEYEALVAALLGKIDAIEMWLKEGLIPVMNQYPGK